MSINIAGYSTHASINSSDYQSSKTGDRGSVGMITTTQADQLSDLLVGYLDGVSLFPTRKDAKGFKNDLEKILDPNASMSNLDKVKNDLVAIAKELKIDTSIDVDKKRNAFNKNIDKLSQSDGAVLRLTLAILTHVSSAPLQEKGWVIDSLISDHNLWMYQANYKDFSGTTSGMKDNVYTGKSAVIPTMIKHMIANDQLFSGITPFEASGGLNDQIDSKYESYQPDNAGEKKILDAQDALDALKKSYSSEAKIVASLDRNSAKTFAFKSKYDAYEKTNGAISDQIQKINKFRELETKLAELNKKFSSATLVGLYKVFKEVIPSSKGVYDTAYYGKKLSSVLTSIAKIFEDGDKPKANDRKSIIGLRKGISLLFDKKKSITRILDQIFISEVETLKTSVKAVADAMATRQSEIKDKLAEFRDANGSQAEKNVLSVVYDDYKKLSLSTLASFSTKKAAIDSVPGKAVLNKMAENIEEIKAHEDNIKKSSDIETTISELKKLKSLYPRSTEVTKRLKVISGIFERIEAIKGLLMKEGDADLILPISKDLSAAVQKQLSDMLSSFASKMKEQNEVVSSAKSAQEKINDAIGVTNGQISTLEVSNKTSAESIRSLSSEIKTHKGDIRTIKANIAVMEADVKTLTSTNEASQSAANKSKETLGALKEAKATVLKYAKNRKTKEAFKEKDDAYFLNDKNWAEFNEILDLAVFYSVVASKDDIGFTTDDFKKVMTDTKVKVDTLQTAHTIKNTDIQQKAGSDQKILDDKIAEKVQETTEKDTLTGLISDKKKRIDDELNPLVAGNNKQIAVLTESIEAKQPLISAEDTKIRNATEVKTRLSSSFDSDINALRASSTVKVALPKKEESQTTISSAQQAQLITVRTDKIPAKDLITKKNDPAPDTKAIVEPVVSSQEKLSKAVRTAIDSVKTFIADSKFKKADEKLANIKKAVNQRKIKGFDEELLSLEKEINAGKQKKAQYATAANMKSQMSTLLSTKTKLKESDKASINEIAKSIAGLPLVGEKDIAALSKMLSNLNKKYAKDIKPAKKIVRKQEVTKPAAVIPAPEEGVILNDEDIFTLLKE